MKTTINLLATGIFLAGFADGHAQTTFTKITTGPIVNDGGASFGCAWGDFNNDGFLDLFVFNTGDASLKTNFLYQNNRDGTFTRVTAGAIANDLGRWTGCAWVDFDNDGRLDLLAVRGADWRSPERDNYFRAIPYSAFKTARK